jgi:hypothetical protein
MLTSLSVSFRSRLPARMISLIAGLILIFAFAGCVSIRSENSAETPVPAPEVTPAAETTQAPLEPAVASIHPAGDQDELRGSALILSSDGLLITTLDNLDGDIEVSLPGGAVHRPALVSISRDLGLGLLKVPESDLTPVDLEATQPSPGTEVFATGFDASSGDLGRMSGEIVESYPPAENIQFPVSDDAVYVTDMNLPDGFSGGAITDEDGTFCGIVVSESSGDDDDTFRAISHWAMSGWLDYRQQRLDSLSDEADSWEVVSLPGDWSMRQPDTWSASISADDQDSFRAELSPGDPDVSLQLSVSVEANEFGTDPEDFVDQVFADRTSARIWTIDQMHDRPFIRASIVQEGALVDVAYVLDEDYLIAFSLTSGYQPESDPGQVDEARALFETVVMSLDRQ